MVNKRADRTVQSYTSRHALVLFPRSTRTGTPFFHTSRLLIIQLCNPQRSIVLFVYRLGRIRRAPLTPYFLIRQPQRTTATFADITRRFEECQQIARSRIVETQATAKLRYDEQHRHVTYEIGDLVWLWVPIRKPRLAKRLI